MILDRSNVIKRKKDYTYRKALPPKVFGEGLVEPKLDPVRHALPAKTRYMTQEERQWWSSPYRELVVSWLLV